MASRPRVFSIVKQDNRAAFNDATDGTQYLTIGVGDVHEKALPHVVLYGLVQAILDAGATHEGMRDRVGKMRARAEAIRNGTWALGERVASGLVMGATFGAARECGLWRDLGDGEAKAKWKELTDMMRARVAAREDVVAKLAESHPTADGELESMFA